MYEGVRMSLNSDLATIHTIDHPPPRMYQTFRNLYPPYQIIYGACNALTNDGGLHFANVAGFGDKPGINNLAWFGGEVSLLYGKYSN